MVEELRHCVAARRDVLQSSGKIEGGLLATSFLASSQTVSSCWRGYVAVEDWRFDRHTDTHGKTDVLWINHILSKCIIIIIYRTPFKPEYEMVSKSNS